VNAVFDERRFRHDVAGNAGPPGWCAQKRTDFSIKRYAKEQISGNLLSIVPFLAKIGTLLSTLKTTEDVHATVLFSGQNVYAGE
jgi:hypothetical protein